MDSTDSGSERSMGHIVAAPWPDEVDSVLAGDVLAVLAVRVGRAGLTLMPVAPAGLRDRIGGTITFTSTLGFWKKLDRIQRQPEVALLFSDRSHGKTDVPLNILIQGVGSVETKPNVEFLTELLHTRFPEFSGPAIRGRVWDRISYQYSWVRVRVTVDVMRLLAWDSAGDTVAEPLDGGHPAVDPLSNHPPRQKVAPLVSLNKAARRASRLRNTTIRYICSDGYPFLSPATVGAATTEGLSVTASQPLPDGGTRAALLSHHYGRHLQAMAEQHHTGWLETTPVGSTFIPWTSRGFTAPLGKRTATLVGSMMAKRGLRRARKLGLVHGERWVGPGKTTLPAGEKEEEE